MPVSLVSGLSRILALTSRGVGNADAMSKMHDDSEIKWYGLENPEWQLPRTIGHQVEGQSGVLSYDFAGS